MALLLVPSPNTIYNLERNRMLRSFMPLAISSWLALFLFLPAQCNTFDATVIGISDGDTIKVLCGHTSYKLRLAGIDCPEKAQAFGEQARLLTARLAFNKSVRVITHSQDRYERLIADVILPDQTNLSADLVREGYAWWYQDYAKDDLRLAALELDARVHHRGLWHDKDCEAPWAYRRRLKEAREQERAGKAFPKTIAGASL